jgi:hypothetical protein
MKKFRQGDVVIQPEKIPTEATRKEGLVLAEGEVTGHAHRIVRGNAELYRDFVKGLLWMKVLSEYATLVHEEHEDIELPMGEYSVKIQREWDWFSEEVRNVAD